jgi:hypothetical protein
MFRQANILKTIRQATQVLLLVLYGAAAFKVDSFHAFFHAQELKELHSAEQENNPCHKSVYHQESQAGCEHKSHITENTKCPLCEYNVTPDQLVEELANQSKAALSHFKQTIWFDAVLASAIFSHSSRGPPANV